MGRYLNFDTRYESRRDLRNYLRAVVCRKNRALYVVLFTFFTLYLLAHSRCCDIRYTQGIDYVIQFEEIHKIKNTVPRILLWTPFFNSPWITHVQSSLNHCECACNVTDDRNEIENVDIVIFHMLDLWFWESIPSYRDPHQVWVLYVAEPPPHIHYTGRTLRFPRTIFNWTFSYRKDSTVFTPYGRSKPKQEVKTVTPEKNYASGKSKMVASVTSNCYDDAKRYRVLHDLSRYVQVDRYGRCGNLTCPRESGVCAKILQAYRFTIAFENSNCRDYVSEKFWNSLMQGSIPLVNWKPQQKPDNVPPKSYINVYDFKTMKDLGDYLLYLSSNEEEYNSYFSWRNKYEIVNGQTIWGQFCDFCCSLKAVERKSQVVDYVKWLESDICQTWSIKRAFHRRFDRWAFELGA